MCATFAPRMAGRVGWADTTGLGQRVPGAVSVLLWLAAGAAMALGVLHGLGQRPDVTLPAPPSAPWAVDTPAVARALGARATAAAPVAAAPVVADNRYALLGVVAAAGGGSGVALIAVEGQRPQPYRVGAVLDGRWQVRAVQRRSVELVAHGATQPVTAGAGAGAEATQPPVLTLSLPLPPSLLPR